MTSSNKRSFTPEVFKDGAADQNADTPKSPWELHFVFQVLQLLETVWVEMLTGSYGEHSLNPSWNEIIRRWARARMVQKYWEDLSAAVLAKDLPHLNADRPAGGDEAMPRSQSSGEDSAAVTSPNVRCVLATVHVKRRRSLQPFLLTPTGEKVRF